MSNVLIIGATSAIAEATARRYAANGDNLFLLGRDVQRLEAIAADLRVRGAGHVGSAPLDVENLEQHPAALDAAWQALGHIDVALIAHGSLPDQLHCERMVAQAVRAFSLNATTTLALLLLIAGRLEAQGHGCLAVIGSVAGDRGRASNYVYGGAKAAIECFASGLRQRLHAKGVNVLLIKPGFVDTPMTHAFRKGLLWSSSERIADGIVRAVARRGSVAYLPGFWRGIMLAVRHLPEALFKRITL